MWSHEGLHLSHGGHEIGASLARDHDGAGSVAQTRRPKRWPPAQVTADIATGKSIAGAEHIVDLDREAPADDAVLQIVGDRALIDDAAHRAALEHDGGGPAPVAIAFFDVFLVFF